MRDLDRLTKDVSERVQDAYEAPTSARELFETAGGYDDRLEHLARAVESALDELQLHIDENY